MRLYRPLTDAPPVAWSLHWAAADETARLRAFAATAQALAQPDA